MPNTVKRQIGTIDKQDPSRQSGSFDGKVGTSRTGEALPTNHTAYFLTCLPPYLPYLPYLLTRLGFVPTYLTHSRSRFAEHLHRTISLPDLDPNCCQPDTTACIERESLDLGCSWSLAYASRHCLSSNHPDLEGCRWAHISCV